MSGKVRSVIISFCVVLVIAAMLLFTVNKFRHDREQAKIKTEQERKEPMLKYIDKMPSISDRYKEKK